MKKLKLAIIGTVGVPANYGGFETLAHHLVLQLASIFQISVYNSSAHYEKEDRVPYWKGARIHYLPLKANGIQSIAYDIFSIIHAAIFADVLLILGVSGCTFLPILKLFTNKKVIVNIDGLEWRRAKWNGPIKKFLKFSEKMAVRYADDIITDNAAIQDYVAEEYGIRSLLIEYGGSHAKKVAIHKEYMAQYPFLAGDYAFKVCRIEPENNIEMVLEAFARQTNLPLVLVGNWHHSDFGKEVRARYESYEQLYLLDPIYDSFVLNMLRSNCALYVHGHSAGGTNPSLVEAMSLELPILSFDVIYNRVTTEGKALFFQSAEQISTTLQETKLQSIKNLGERMSKIAKRRYTWEVIAEKYAFAIAHKQSKVRPVSPVFPAITPAVVEIKKAV